MMKYYCYHEEKKQRKECKFVLKLGKKYELLKFKILYIAVAW